MPSRRPSRSSLRSPRFEHPTEQAVQHDPAAEALWKTNPNLVINGDFSQPGKWQALYQAEKYEVVTQDQPPAVDKVVIQHLTEAGATNNVLAMKLSRTCAENNGMACLSEAIKIQPKTRYRLSFRYKSDGPGVARVRQRLHAVSQHQGRTR